MHVRFFQSCFLDYILFNRLYMYSHYSILKNIYSNFWQILTCDTCNSILFNCVSFKSVAEKSKCKKGNWLFLLKTLVKNVQRSFSLNYTKNKLIFSIKKDWNGTERNRDEMSGKIIIEKRTLQLKALVLE